MKLVCNLKAATDAYWAAGSHRESQAAYHETLLFGGVDGYPPAGPVRSWLAQQARRFALWVEQRDLSDRSIEPTKPEPKEDPHQYIKVHYRLPGAGKHAEFYNRQDAGDMEAFEKNEKEFRWPVLSVESVDKSEYLSWKKNQR